MTSHSVYFASTILHLYAAASIAAGRQSEIAHLIFIDQPEDKEFPLYSIVQQWSSSPFERVRLMPGRFKGIVNKLKKRKQLFNHLEKIILDLKPSNIFVGNDRRIEFQFSMHIAETLGLKTKGHYMDEGTFTYVGRKASSRFSDAVVDNWLKKLSYGLWWKNPLTVGESAWVEEIHVAFPDLIDSRLINKVITQLDHTAFTSVAMTQLSNDILAFYKFNADDLANLDALFTLPHESLFTNNSGYRNQILEQVTDLKSRGLQIAVKYHPRNSSSDALNLQSAGVKLIPAGISFEAILPLLPKKAHIIGDLSSTLLIARWLRPELEVTSIYTGDGNPEFNTLFTALNITLKKV
ncbi:MAG: hypothetical protein ACI83B_003398 [Sediminicola sp.]|jgi:hypothetical protein